MSFITGRPAVVVACSRSEPALFGARIFTTASCFWTGPIPPASERERRAGARGPITMRPDLTAIRGPGISSATLAEEDSMVYRHDPEPRGRYLADKGSRLNPKEAAFALSFFHCRKEVVKAVCFNENWKLNDILFDRTRDPIPKKIYSEGEPELDPLYKKFFDKFVVMRKLKK